SPVTPSVPATDPRQTAGHNTNVTHDSDESCRKSTDDNRRNCCSGPHSRRSPVQPGAVITLPEMRFGGTLRGLVRQPKIGRRAVISKGGGASALVPPPTLEQVFD